MPMHTFYCKMGTTPIVGVLRASDAILKGRQDIEHCRHTEALVNLHHGCDSKMRLPVASLPVQKESCPPLIAPLISPLLHEAAGIGRLPEQAEILEAAVAEMLADDQLLHLFPGATFLLEAFLHLPAARARTATEIEFPVLKAEFCADTGENGLVLLVAGRTASGRPFCVCDIHAVLLKSTVIHFLADAESSARSFSRSAAKRTIVACGQVSKKKYSFPS